MTLFVDFETYYNSKIGYTLKKLSGVEYIRDPRFQILVVGVALNDNPVQTFLPHQLDQLPHAFDWANKCVVAHKTIFDGLILHERLGITPKQWGCTLSMARALLPLDRNDLNTISKLLGIGAKVDGYLTEGAEEADKVLIEGVIRDVELCRGVFDKLTPFLPPEQFGIINRIQRWGIQGQFIFNQQLLEQELDRLLTERHQAIEASGYTEKQLSSNKQFKDILEDLGIEAPTKISLATGNETDAFASNDPAYLALLREYPEHETLWTARKLVKSNIHITRIQRYLNIAKTNKPMPMPLNYYGAKTGRPTGADSLNVLNLPKKGLIRQAFTAPPGHQVLVADSSQIELRVNFWFCRQLDNLHILENDQDLYKAEASRQFHKAIEDITDDERQFGKIVQLGCGYRMGPIRLRELCASGPLGMPPIHISETHAKNTIRIYRDGNAHIEATWFWLDQIIPQMTQPNCDVKRHPVRFLHNAVELPNGMHLLYPNLRYQPAHIDPKTGRPRSASWMYGIGDTKNFIHGGTLLENIIQALANIIISEQIDNFEQQYPQVSVSYTYDEIINVIKDDLVERAEQTLVEVMSTSPPWAPDLPLGAKAKRARYYSK